MLEKLRELNPGLDISDVGSETFRTYGRILPYVELKQMAQFVRSTPMPEDEYYCPLSEELMESEEAEMITRYVFGGVPCQIGYYNGRVTELNALEYHKCSEVLYLLEDVVLLVAHIWEMDSDQLDSSCIKAFYVPKNSCVELYATTLHYAPCMAGPEGARQIVVQSLGTNTDMDQSASDQNGENRLLYQKNKWLIVHPEAEALVKAGGYIGITGENLKVRYL